MKLLKSALRFWITTTSVISFVGGWVILAHAPKPGQLNSQTSNDNLAPLPTLEPLPPLSGLNTQENNFQNQPLFSVQPQTRARVNPFFMTGGS